MDPNLVFWTAALPVFAGIVGTAFAGWRAIRRDDVAAHKRYMTASVSLVLFFVAAYVGKVLFLGKEDLGLWSSGERAVLFTHEIFVFSMVVAGTIARLLARQLDPDREGAVEGPLTRTRHRRAGRAAIVASAFGLLTAILVLAGMYGRAG